MYECCVSVKRQEKEAFGSPWSASKARKKPQLTLSKVSLGLRVSCMSCYVAYVCVEMHDC